MAELGKHEFKIKDEVVLRGMVVVTSSHSPKVLVQTATQGARRVWIHKNSLTHDVSSPSPVTHKCGEMHEKGDRIWVKAQVRDVHSDAPRRYHVVIVGDAKIKPRFWIDAQHTCGTPGEPPPVMVRCNKCGFERPLTDLETLEARCEALGLPMLIGHGFMEVCAALKEKGVTPQQFVEGL